MLALLGLLTPDTGTVRAGDVDLATIDRSTWWSQISWLPQRSALPPGSIREVLTADPLNPPSEQDLTRAMRLTGLDAVVADLPEGLETVLGHGGLGLSVGQRQRVALTAALLGDRPLVVLDEPTAHLDALAEDQVLETIAALRAAGRTVVVVAHRPTLVARADDVVEVRSAPRPPQTTSTESTATS